MTGQSEEIYRVEKNRVEYGANVTSVLTYFVPNYLIILGEILIDYQ